jgi:RNA polymerase sigma factor (sigma-70 family)
MGSQKLLTEYATQGSEKAFQELVACYVDLVYSTALRLVDGDAHLAKDVVQTVFVDLARMARQLSPGSLLGGWLHRHTCYVARTLMRGERRRRERERLAMEMDALNYSPDTVLKEVAPVLDEAIQELGADDRDALLLRFYERQNLRAVGEALGISENVAQKRVARALQELARVLQRRGFGLPAAALAGALSTGAVTAAPAGLALSIATTAIAGNTGAAGTTAASVGAGFAAKSAAAILSVLLVAGVVSTWLWKHRAENLPENALPTAETGAAVAQAPGPQEPFGQEPASAPFEPPSVVATTDGATVQQQIATMTVSPVEPPTTSAATATAPAVLTGGASRTIRYHAQSGSRLTVEGTAVGQVWRAESTTLGGFLELEDDLSPEPALELKTGPLKAQAEVVLPLSSLGLIDENGSANFGKLNSLLHQALNPRHQPSLKILFHLTRFKLEEISRDPALPHRFEASGKVVIGKTTNEITMPVFVLSKPRSELLISGAAALAMSAFKVVPPVWQAQTPDDPVQVRFDWKVAAQDREPGTPPRQDLVPLVLQLPNQGYKTLPNHFRHNPGLEPSSEQPRPPMLVPAGLRNLARGTRVSCSDQNAPDEALAKVVDGDKEASEQSIIYLRKGLQWVQLDLREESEVFAVVLWHAHNTPKVYHDVIVQASNDPDFLEDVRTLYNNDRDYTSSDSGGADREYVESYEGKLIDAKKVRGRYLRFYSKGSSESALNEYTEIEVYGRALPRRQGGYL